MALKHRVEVVYHALDALYEQWQSADRSIILQRKRGERVWTATVDNVHVVDAQRLHGSARKYETGGPTHQEARMVCTTAHNLAMLLAVQDLIHIVFDA